MKTQKEDSIDDEIDDDAEFIRKKTQKADDIEDEIGSDSDKKHKSSSSSVEQVADEIEDDYGF